MGGWLYNTVVVVLAAVLEVVLGALLVILEALVSVPRVVAGPHLVILEAPVVVLRVVHQAHQRDLRVVLKIFLYMLKNSLVVLDTIKLVLVLRVALEALPALRVVAVPLLVMREVLVLVPRAVLGALLAIVLRVVAVPHPEFPLDLVEVIWRTEVIVEFLNPVVIWMMVNLVDMLLVEVIGKVINILKVVTEVIMRVPMEDIPMDLKVDTRRVLMVDI